MANHDRDRQLPWLPDQVELAAVILARSASMSTAVLVSTSSTGHALAIGRAFIAKVTRHASAGSSLGATGVIGRCRLVASGFEVPEGAVVVDSLFVWFDPLRATIVDRFCAADPVCRRLTPSQTSTVAPSMDRPAGGACGRGHGDRSGEAGDTGRVPSLGLQRGYLTLAVFSCSRRSRRRRTIARSAPDSVHPHPMPEH